jgi:hypothetical protein
MLENQDAKNEMMNFTNIAIFDVNVTFKGSSQPARDIFKLNGKCEAEVLGGVLGELGGEVVSNLTQSVAHAITGGETSNPKAQDRPQIGLVTSVVNFGSFPLKTGGDNTSIDTTQYVAYNKSNISSVPDHSLQSLLHKKFLVSRVTQNTTDPPDTVLYRNQISIDPLRDQQVGGAMTRMMTFTAMSKFFQYYKFRSVQLTVVPVATVFHKTTIVLSANIGGTGEVSLQQASNQISTTLEVDGTGQSATIEVPFASPYSFLMVNNGLENTHYRGSVSDAGTDFFRFVMGEFQLTVATYLTANSDVVSNSIDYLIYWQFNDVKFRMPNDFVNAPLIRDPTFRVDPIQEYFGEEKKTSSRHKYFPRLRGKAESGIIDGNSVVGSTSAERPGTHNSVGGILAETFDSYASRQNFIQYATISSSTPIGPLVSYGFTDLISNQARIAMGNFVMVDLSSATLEIDVTVQGNPTVAGALGANFVPLASKGDVLKLQPDPMSMCMCDNFVVTQLNGINSFVMSVDLSTIVGGPAFTNQLYRAEFSPGVFQLRLIAPYRAGPASSTPDPITILLRTKITGMKFSVPIVAPDIDTLRGTAPTDKRRTTGGEYDMIKLSDALPKLNGRVESAMMTGPEDSVGEIKVDQQTEMHNTGIQQTTEMTGDDVDKALKNSWFPIIQWTESESKSAQGTSAGLLNPLYMSFSDLTSGAQFDTATTLPRFKNVCITDEMWSENPTGYSDAQCAFLRPHPVSVFGSFYRIANTDISLSFRIKTKSGTGDYAVQVFYNPDVLAEGYNFENPFYSGSFQSGITASALAIVRANDEWTNVTIPWTNMMGSVMTASSSIDQKRVVFNPFVVRVVSQPRSGPGTGDNIVVPTPTPYDFGKWNGKVYLDTDISTLNVLMRLGENCRFSIPVSLPNVWYSTVQQAGVMSAGAAIVNVPSKFRILPDQGTIPNFTLTQDEITAHRNTYEFDSTIVAYDPTSPNAYWKSLELKQFLVPYSSIPRTLIASWTGLTIGADDILVGDDTVMDVTHNDSILKVPEYIPVNVTSFTASGPVSLGLDINTFVSSNLILRLPGTNNTYYPQIVLNGNVWKLSAYVNTLPAQVQGKKYIPTTTLSNVTHDVAYSGTPWANVPDSNLKTSNVFTDSGHVFGLLQGTVNLMKGDVKPEAKVLDLPKLRGKCESGYGVKMDMGNGGVGLVPAGGRRGSDDDEDEGDDDDDPPGDNEDDKELELEESDYSSDEGEDKFYTPSPSLNEAQPVEESKYDDASEIDKDSLFKRVRSGIYSLYAGATKAPKKILEELNAFFSKPIDYVKACVSTLTTYVSKMANTVKQTIVSNTILDTATEYWEYIKQLLRDTPIFVLVTIVLLLITELLSTSTVINKVLPFLIRPFVKVGSTILNLLADAKYYLNSAFLKAYETTKSVFGKADRVMEESGADDLPETLQAMEESPEIVTDANKSEGFGTKVSHWFGVLVNFFTTSFTVANLKTASKVAGASLAFIFWIERHMSAGSRLFTLIGKLFPRFYTYVMGIWCRDIPPGLEPIEVELKHIREFLLLDLKSPAAKQLAARFEFQTKNVTRFYWRSKRYLSDDTVRYLDQLLTQCKVALTQCPVPSSSSTARVKTMFVMLCGDERIGKSSTMTTLESLLASPSEVAHMNFNADFRIESSHYSGERLINVPEMVKIDTQEHYEQFINFLNGLVEHNTFCAESANASDKGNVYVHPEVFLTTSNYNFAKRMPGSIKYGSTLDRMLLIRAMVRPEYCKNGTHLPDWERIEQDFGEDNFAEHLLFYPMVATRGRKRIGKYRESYAEGSDNPEVLVGRELGSDHVIGYNGVDCPAEMDINDLIVYLNNARASLVRDFNRHIAFRRLAADKHRCSFDKDVQKLLSGKSKITRMSAISAVRNLLIQVWAKIQKEIPDTLGSEEMMLMFTHPKGPFSINQVTIRPHKQIAGDLMIKAERKPTLDEFCKQLNDSELGYLLYTASMGHLPVGDLAEACDQLNMCNQQRMSQQEAIEALIEQREFTQKYILHDLSSPVEDFQLRLAENKNGQAEDFFYLYKFSKEQSKWRKIRSTSAVWTRIKTRVYELANIFSNSGMPNNGGNVDTRENLPYQAVEELKVTPFLVHPFEHKFWCSEGLGCKCVVADRGFEKTVLGVIDYAWAHPLASLFVGLASYRIVSNIYQVVSGIQTIMQIGNNSDPVESKIVRVPHLTYYDSLEQKQTMLHSYSFGVLESVISLRQMVDDVDGRDLDSIEGETYREKAVAFLIEWCNAKNIDLNSLKANFCVEYLSGDNTVRRIEPAKWTNYFRIPLTIFGQPVVKDYLVNFIAGVFRIYGEGKGDDYFHELNGVAESKTGTTRTRRIKMKKRTVHKPGARSARAVLHKLDGKTESKHVEVLEERMNAIVSRIRSMTTKVTASNSSSYSAAFDIGYNCFVTTSHGLVSRTKLPRNRLRSDPSGFNIIPDKVDITLTDQNNVKLPVGVTADQITRMRSISFQHELDLCVIDLGNGTSTRKAGNMFLTKDELLNRVTFDDVKLVKPDGDVIEVGQVKLKPTTGVRVDHGQHEYVHDGLLIAHHEEDFTGLCSCPYVAPFRGNYFIIGFHSSTGSFPGVTEGHIGILVSKEMIKTVYPTREKAIVEEPELPLLCDYDPKSGMVVQREAKASDPTYGNVTRFSNTDSFKRYYEGKIPAVQYIGEVPARKYGDSKTSLVKSPVYGKTNTSHLHAPAFLGDEKVSSQDMAELGLARTTVRPNRMSASNYNSINKALRAVFVTNPPDYPIKQMLTQEEAINGGWADVMIEDSNIEKTGAFFSSTREDCAGDGYFEGTIPVKALDSSSSAGWGLPSGLKQRDFFTKKVFVNKSTLDKIELDVIDTSLPHGNDAQKLLDKIINEFLEGKKIWFVFGLCLKDEALAIKELKPWLEDIFPEVEELPKGGKTRIFTILCFVCNIALKMFLGPAIAYIKSLKEKARWATGINAYSPEWEEAWSIFLPVQDSLKCFMGADVSDQEAHIDGSTISGLIALLEIIYEVQNTVWTSQLVSRSDVGKTWQLYKHTLQREPQMFKMFTRARAAALTSVCPSLNRIGGSLFLAILRNQSGTFVTALLSWYYSCASEEFSFEEGIELYFYLCSQFATDAEPISINDKRLLACGDDQVTCYREKVLKAFAKANDMLNFLPKAERKRQPVPIVFEGTQEEKFGSFIRAVTLFHTGVELVDPETGGVPVVVEECKVPFLGNLTLENPLLTDQVKHLSGKTVRKFAVLEQNRTVKCLNWIRVPDDGCAHASLIQNMNTVLELSFTRGQEDYENMYYHFSKLLGGEVPLLTFDDCVSRFVDRTYVLGEDTNVFPIR